MLLPPDTQPDLPSELATEQFALIHHGSPHSSLTALVIAVLFWSVLWWHTRDPLVLIWAGALHTGQLVRLFWVRKYMARPRVFVQRASWRKGYFLLLLVNGTTWAAAPLLFLSTVAIAWQAFIVLVCLVMFRAGLTWLAAVKPAMLAFSLPQMVGLPLAFYLLPHPAYKAMAPVVLAYLVISWVLAMHQHKTLIKLLVEQLEKRALAEQLVRQVRVARQASEEKTHFLAAASHDLRQPLHALALFAAVIDRQRPPDVAPEHTAQLGGLVRQLGESLDTMLDVARLDAGIVEKHMATTALQPLFESLNRIYSPQASDKGLELRIRATGLFANTDRGHLERILSNLISNAIRYTHEGAVLVVARPRGEQVWIDVWDSGTGIPDEQVERVFEAYYQLANPGRDRSKGLGIGLAIVKRLCELLGHQVEVRSVPGRGSRFRVRLDRMPEPPPTESVAPDATGVTLPLADNAALPNRVLLLDDEPDSLAACSAWLRAHGLTVQAASSVAEAEAALFGKGAEVDVFICDYRLAHGADGLAYALDVRARKDQALPVVMVTGETSPTRLQLLREAGLDVLFKPIRADELLRVLARINATRRVAVGHGSLEK